MLTWYKNEEHRIKRLEQMRTYYYKKKQALFIIIFSHEKKTIEFK